jgi:pimeloyl-ACP methyl ester carboxylesterase
MKSLHRGFTAAVLSFAGTVASAQTTQVVDLPTRDGITERMVAIAPDAPKATVILLAGGPGRVKIFDNGSIRNEGNFLVRSRALFAQQGLAAVVLDAPSDHSGGMPVSFRESAEHVADLAAAIAWARAKWGKPVWLVGTSRGTQSAAHVAVALANDTRGPDGIVMTSSILARSKRDGGTPVQEQALDKLKIPVLVIHHENDPCPICAPSLLRELKLPPSGKLVMESGGTSTGEPCEPFSHHGYNGIEGRVVADIAAWVMQAGPR